MQGFSIKNDAPRNFSDTWKVIISRVVDRGLAQQTGSVQLGLTMLTHVTMK